MNAKSKDPEEVKRRILKKRAEILSKPIDNQKIMIDLLEIIPFRLGAENFAIETKYVKEIYPLKNTTFLPCAPNFVYGLTNVRRRILPIIDLKIVFSIPDSEKQGRQLLIVESEEAEFAILIDGYSTVREIPKNDLQASLPTLTGIREDFLKGLIVDGTVILDGQKLLSSSYLVI